MGLWLPVITMLSNVQAKEISWLPASLARHLEGGEEDAKNHYFIIKVPLFPVQKDSTNHSENSPRLLSDFKQLGTRYQPSKSTVERNAKKPRNIFTSYAVPFQTKNMQRANHKFSYSVKSCSEYLETRNWLSSAIIWKTSLKIKNSHETWFSSINLLIHSH